MLPLSRAVIFIFAYEKGAQKRCIYNLSIIYKVINFTKHRICSKDLKLSFSSDMLMPFFIVKLNVFNLFCFI